MSSRELNGKEETKTNSRDFIVGAFLGALAGAAAALLLTPKSGRDLRSTINGQTSSILDRTDEIKGKAISKSNEFALAAKEKANTVVNSMSQQSSELLKKVKEQRQFDETDIEAQAAEESQPRSYVSTSEEIQRKLEETQKAFDETEMKLNH
ncbi:Gas vesicle protein [Mesobacillus persicus]|uniref:Gas vesicle protein n=1 Tax=Mesobacillus persicus TaxID=930146 RepID=A0A1H7XZ23_9BACI|nr:YtxH domain-containing protein [Mesobacillus persicus]SEM38963.1 Gas vesicle protein [Mesobacillus persicus]